MKNYKQLFFLTLVSICVLCTPSYAQKLYKRVDKDGNVSYHDESERKSGDNSTEIKPTIAPQAIVQQPTQLEQSNPVIVYTSQACEPCVEVLDYLNKQGIEAQEQSINDREVQERIFAEAGSLSVPSILIGDVLMTDVNEDALVSALQNAGYSIGALGDTSSEPDSSAQEEDELIEEPIDLSEELQIGDLDSEN